METRPSGACPTALVSFAHWRLSRCVVAAVAFLPLSVVSAQEVGRRPYEMEWVGRTEDHTLPLVDFEEISGWRVTTHEAEARIVRTREQQIWGKHVAKLVYRGTGTRPEIRFGPPDPIAFPDSCDAVSCWIYGNNWGTSRDPSTPGVQVSMQLRDRQGNEIGIPLTTVNWKEWFLCHRRLSPEQIEALRPGGTFVEFIVTMAHNREDRVLYFDNLAIYAERSPPLSFAPRRQRGIPMFPGQGTGTNTGPGTLPFPTRDTTILPPNLTTGFVNETTQEGDFFVFAYRGDDGQLTYRYRPDTGGFSDLQARWQGFADWFSPCLDGGPRLARAQSKSAMVPQSATHVGTQLRDGVVISRWQLQTGETSADVVYSFRIWAKSIVIDVASVGGGVAEVHYGRARGLPKGRYVALPYYTYGSTRPAVAIFGDASSPLFVMGNTDWYLSNASEPWAVNHCEDGSVFYNGGVRYVPRTDRRRNDCFERFFVTVSPRLEEVMPEIPNPVSPWREVTGKGVWHPHGASNREQDAVRWRKAHRYGLRKLIITDHETGWRDGGESFTFRTRTAPGKGGDPGQFEYARIMQDELGFVYGPYNNFTDFAPVNQFWTFDMISRTPEKQLQTAWMRCYAPKPARAVEYCELLAPQIEAKFHFSTAYCDVHTAVTPWSRVDYDARVPGAGTFAAVFYAYGEIMLLQKEAWGGPVYSEGSHHAYYCGLTDGNYAQDRRANLKDEPWLVDFDLRRMHDLCSNFGMGYISMFYGRNPDLGSTREEVDASIDRFLAATVAFGHTGYLIFEGGYHNTLRSYYMLQQLHSRYALASPVNIRYADSDGRLLSSTEAIASGVYRGSQVVADYSDGTVTVVNGNKERSLSIQAHGRRINLPPNGYAGWTKDGAVDVFSGLVDGHRADYAVTPDYIFVDGRGSMTRFPMAASDRIGICRRLGDGRFEIIPYEGADCGFAISAESAVALDVDGGTLGPAQTRTSRGRTHVVPVEGAFSYMLRGTDAPPDSPLTCQRDAVVPGEQVTVHGKEAHTFRVSEDALPGERLWREIEDAWIDFTVVPLTEHRLALEEDTLAITLAGNMPGDASVTVNVDGVRKRVRLPPQREATTSFDLGPAEEETADIVDIRISHGTTVQRLLRSVRVSRRFRRLIDLPSAYQAGMQLRGAAETRNFGRSGAGVYREDLTCGSVLRRGFSMHPPWKAGVGYTFALLGPIVVPEGESAFRALVGKRDGSFLGDGVAYRVAVVDPGGRETTVGERLVAKHEWLPIEGDLSPWSGQSIRLKLVSDVGANDDSNGDWACWADQRIETPRKILVRELGETDLPLDAVPSPFPLPGIGRNDLRQATRAWVHYDGQGLEGGDGRYATYAVVNGIRVGPMQSAPGNSTTGAWTEGCTVPLTPEAIRTLDRLNRFELDNPGKDWFKVGRAWLRVELADGRMCSTQIDSRVFTQPPGWKYAEGIGVPHGTRIGIDLWFPR